MPGTNESTPSESSIEAVEPADLRNAIDAGEPVTILDVRATEEFEEWHVDGENVTIENLPYVELVEGITDDHLSRVPDGGPLVVVCAKGGASEWVAEQLVERGFDAVNLSEGMNGWARVYDACEIRTADTDATVVQFQRPSSGCLSYAVFDGDEAVVVDPLRAFTDRYVSEAVERGCSVTSVLDTHVHADHVSGARELVAATGADFLLPEQAVERGVDYDVEVTTVADGDTVPVGGISIEVRSTPGHTSGMTSYLVDDAVLLSGDGLFTESVARPDLEEGAEGAPDAAGQLYDTLQDLLRLPADVVVAPAHFGDAATPAADGTYTARLGDLAEGMDALRLDRDEFVDFVLADMPPRPANYEEVIDVNLGRERVDDDEAFRLELGPNNCAATQDAMVDD